MKNKRDWIKKKRDVPFNMNASNKNEHASSKHEPPRKLGWHNKCKPNNKFLHNNNDMFPSKAFIATTIPLQMECPLLSELKEQAEARKRAERLGRLLEVADQKPVAEWITSVDGKFADAFCTECVAETDDQSELRTCLVNIIKAWKVKGRVGVILAHPDQHLWHAIEFVAAFTSLVGSRVRTFTMHHKRTPEKKPEPL
jgi:hypothetical protein